METQMDTMEIPPSTQCDLTVADYDEILTLWRRAGLSVRPDGRDAPEAFARQLAGGLQRVVGLRAGNELVAVVVLTHDGRKGWINRLAVDPGFRRRGLASRLIAEAERWFSEVLGLEIWAALIESENHESQALFGRAGYGRHDLVYVSKRTRPGV
jgi:N-acetylglutamate synthase